MKTMKTKKSVKNVKTSKSAKIKATSKKPTADMRIADLEATIANLNMRLEIAESLVQTLRDAVESQKMWKMNPMPYTVPYFYNNCEKKYQVK